MNADELCLSIKQRLHPDPYQKDLEPSEPFDFVLMRASAMPGGRYAFAFLRLPDEPTDSWFENMRAVARRVCKSTWLLREVGLYVLVCGPSERWAPLIEQAPADKTGLHHIIVQCVHFVDPETGANHLNRSSWGPVKFGGLIPIDQMVGEVLSTL